MIYKNLQKTGLKLVLSYMDNSISDCYYQHIDALYSHIDTIVTLYKEEETDDKSRFGIY